MLSDELIIVASMQSNLRIRIVYDTVVSEEPNLILAIFQLNWSHFEAVGLTCLAKGGLEKFIICCERIDIFRTLILYFSLAIFRND